MGKAGACHSDRKCPQFILEIFCVPFPPPPPPPCPCPIFSPLTLSRSLFPFCYTSHGRYHFFLNLLLHHTPPPFQFPTTAHIPPPHCFSSSHLQFLSLQIHSCGSEIPTASATTIRLSHLVSINVIYEKRVCASTRTDCFKKKREKKRRRKYYVLGVEYIKEQTEAKKTDTKKKCIGINLDFVSYTLPFYALHI